MRGTTSLVSRKRIAILFLLVSGFITLLLGRLTYVQVVRNDLYRSKALEQRLRPVPVDAKRGTIYDRMGRELAVSVSADSVYAIPAEVQNPKEVSRVLSPILDMSSSDIYNKLKTRVSTVWVKRKVTPHQADMVRKTIKRMKLSGIGVAERSQRFYPKEKLASHVLGLAGIDNQGLEGLEVYYDKYLKGAPGRIVAERDGKGREIPEGVSRYIPPQNGDDLYLTIDEVIQYIVERELDKAMAATGATKGVVIVMDPMTGEILALANRPDYNPNNIKDYPTSARRNTALADSYEPGSTFKTITSAAALEEGVVRPTDQFDDPGFIIVEDRRIKCWKAGGHGHQTFIQAVQNSCNPVFVRLATGLGRDKFYDYINAFGFGKKTSVDFPGEAPGLLAPKAAVGPVELATIGFGQGVSVTPLQMLNGLCTIVNGGYLMQPHFAKVIKEQKGKVVKEFPPVKVRQVISETTSKELTSILESVVSEGSGSNGQVPGYRVGGKTGTAQIPDKGRYGNKVVASFMGFAPVEHPRFAALVALYEPNTSVTFGSVLAAPVFGAIAKDVLRYMEVKPTEKTEEEKRLAKSGAEKPQRIEVPDVRNLPVIDAIDTLIAAGLKGKYQGEGDIVYDQVPKPGVRIARDSTVILDLSIPKQIKNSAEVTVPDLKGRSIKDVGSILARIGLKLKLSGTGLAAEQIPPSGTKLKWGSQVEVKFVEPDVSEIKDARDDQDLYPEETGSQTDRIDMPESEETVSVNAKATDVSGLHP